MNNSSQSTSNKTLSILVPPNNGTAGSTDLTFASEGETIGSNTIPMINETIGSTNLQPHYQGSRITEKARALLPAIQDQQIGQSLKNLINIIDKGIRVFEITGGDKYKIAPIRASLLEDKSILLEWVSPDFRLGFNIETNPEDSSWIIVTSKRLKEIVAQGSLSDKDDPDIVSMILNFIYSNS